MGKGLYKQLMVLSVSTDSFFNDKENEIATRLMDIRIDKKELLNIKLNRKSDNKEINEKLIEQINETISQGDKDKSEVINSILDDIMVIESTLSKKLNILLEANEDVRALRHSTLVTYNKLAQKEVYKSSSVVALFESSFTRLLGLDTEDVNSGVIIIRAFHYKVLKDLIKKGFRYLGDDFVFWSASAGQMKTKKCVFVKKSLLEQKHVNKSGETYTVENSLTCGLSWKRINNTKFKKDDLEESGININKFLSYLSLQNTATTKWEDFDINQVLVCPDLEIDVTGKVEFIDRDTYEISPVEEKTLPMNVSDGVGLILPELSSKCFQFRINWGKGLLCPFDYLTFIEEANKANPSKNHAILYDVWGNPHDVIKENIKIILSSSQLKTWKYYKSMDEYRQFFIDYNCEAGKCNEEVETNYIETSYQWLQSLTDMSKDELDDIAKATNNDINNIGTDQKVMLRVLGATNENEKKNDFQNALLMYPELLNDSHAKEMIKSKKKSMVEDALSGTLRLEGRRMFVLPDLYAYCEFLFKGDKNPKGLLKKDEVFAKNIKAGTVDIMRSPALYREHGIQQSVKNSDLKKWFVSGGIYINNKNFLSRLLQLDFDGDTVNVCTQDSFVRIAKRNMKGIVPLYYEMSSSPIQAITRDSIYESLILAFGGSIGGISNSITKIWNSAGKMTGDKLTALKLLTAYNNYMIDFSKTNFLPKPVGKGKKLIKKYSGGEVPYFFKWAKGKEKYADKEVVDYIKAKSKKGKVYKIAKHRHVPVVNMLENIILNKNISFKSVAGKFDYKLLMSANKIENEDCELYSAVVKAYINVNKNKKWMIDKDSDDYKENKYVYVAKVIKEIILSAAREVDKKVTDVEVVDILVHYLHSTKKTSNKKTLWESFGDILLVNLKENLSEAKQCEECGNKFRYTKNKVRCDDCQKKKDRENARKRQQKKREKVAI